jgi:hypothetical protein
VIASTLCNLWSRGRFSPVDFVPGGEPVESSPEENWLRFSALAAAHNARIEDGDDRVS